MDRLSGSMENGMEKAMERLNPPTAPSAELPAAGQAANTAPAVSVSVNIENAVTQDNEGMRILADTVADRITPVVTNALGSDSNSY